MEAKSKKKHKIFYPAALTIAGSDSGGGAGIQADLRTFNAFGVFGCTAITAVTSQNPANISRIDPLPPESIAAQISAVMDKIAVKYVKTGMLFSPSVVETVAEAVKKYALSLVCDPVMVATSGAKLLENSAVKAAAELLLPQARWITPNLPEAELLLNKEILPEQIFDAALELYDRFGANILLKGGHAVPGAKGELCRADDAVCRNGKLYRLSSLRTDLPRYASHGTGCTLSAALAACLALELPWKEALCESKAFVFGSLLENIEIGNGIYAMYPPREEYMSSIVLEETDGRRR